LKRNRMKENVIIILLHLRRRIKGGWVWLN
jgi:hypothetical protein